MQYGDYTLLTVSFNNNILTGLMIKSFHKWVGYKPHVVIVDNGDKIPVDDNAKKVFHVIDNFRHCLLADERQPSRNHCAAIDYALNNVIKTKWCVLVDNDILFKPTIKEFINNVSSTYFDCYGEIGWDCTPPDRLYPYLCIINIDKLKMEKIRYFDRNRIIKFNILDKYGRPTCTNPIYNEMDTGYSFYQDIKKTWRIKQLRLDDVCTHLKSGMLANKDVYSWLMQNHNLF